MEKNNFMIKNWNAQNPIKMGSYICRMGNSYIKMCYWDGNKWLDMWDKSLKGIVKEWMVIPYDIL